ncbi:hypothetical protein PR001_g17830 [Phytophthora rubi]|uniref:Uncharacterized protein n=1 Tax=Phytophthora rubi TaxID=129364 RepID=A0A6A3KJW0_9STRA|nr:hypothetical protein PR001_g17830 [Phytophthora rubi]KAE9034351.1 hypothetical protein PR002_g8184 [Phytophthora rubi]
MVLVVVFLVFFVFCRPTVVEGFPEYTTCINTCTCNIVLSIIVVLHTHKNKSTLNV